MRHHLSSLPCGKEIHEQKKCFMRLTIKGEKMKRKRCVLISVLFFAQLSISACSAQSEPANVRVNAPAATLHSIELSFPEDGYSQPQQRRGFVQQILNRIKALPEVESAAVSTPPQPRTVIVEAMEAAKSNLTYSAVTADYFRALRLALIKGRVFYEEEHPDVPGIVILSESAARRLIPDDFDPLGKRISFSQTEKRGSWLEVVGVVADEQNLFGQVRTEIYGLYNQDPASTIRLVVRSKPGSQPVAEKLKTEIQAVDKKVTIDKVQSQ
jgi:putative ABC transport system permease protein